MVLAIIRAVPQSGIASAARAVQRMRVESTSPGPQTSMRWLHFSYGVDVGLVLHQQLGNGGVAFRCRPHQGVLSAVLSCTLGSAPASSNARTVSTLPMRAACMSGVSPDISPALGSAPPPKLLRDGRVGVLGGCRIKRRCAVFVGALRVCASAQEAIDHLHVVAGSRQDQPSPTFNAVPLLRGFGRRQSAGIGGKHDRAERGARQERQNHCPDAHCRSPTGAPTWSVFRSRRLFVRSEFSFVPNRDGRACPGHLPIEALPV